jgi:hypothetical protein
VTITTTSTSLRNEQLIFKKHEVRLHCTRYFSASLGQQVCKEEGGNMFPFLVHCKPFWHRFFIFPQMYLSMDRSHTVQCVWKIRYFFAASVNASKRV